MYSLNHHQSRRSSHQVVETQVKANLGLDIAFWPALLYALVETEKINLLLIQVTARVLLLTILTLALLFINFVGFMFWMVSFRENFMICPSRANLDFYFIY